MYWGKGTEKCGPGREYTSPFCNIVSKLIILTLLQWKFISLSLVSIPASGVSMTLIDSIATASTILVYSIAVICDWKQTCHIMAVSVQNVLINMLSTHSSYSSVEVGISFVLRLFQEKVKRILTTSFCDMRLYWFYGLLLELKLSLSMKVSASDSWADLEWRKLFLSWFKQLSSRS